MLSEDKERSVSLRRDKSELMKACTQTSIPCTRRLFETIESSLQLAHIRGKPIILKTWRLLHVDIFGEKTMEESIADINLSQTPTLL
jgi:hypothetical protein